MQKTIHLVMTIYLLVKELGHVIYNRAIQDIQ